jgi:hypothetical protein
MPQTPDRRPGPAVEEELQLEENPGAPSVVGAVRYDPVTGAFQMRDAAGTFDPRGGGALPAASHPGQVLMSADGSSFSVRQPLVGYGWLVSETGMALVTG